MNNQNTIANNTVRAAAVTFVMVLVAGTIPDYITAFDVIKYPGIFRAHLPVALCFVSMYILTATWRGDRRGS